MKHIKRFNESQFVDGISRLIADEIEEFCNTSLAYLLDDGIEVELRNNVYKCMVKIKHNRNNNMIWGDIKDDFLPFITQLNNKYVITKEYNKGNDIIVGHDFKYSNFTIDKLETIRDSFKIQYIELSVFEKR